MSEKETPQNQASDQANKLDEELRNPPKPQTGTRVDQDKLRAEANQRAKKRPLMTKIIEKFKGEKKPYRELIINSEPLEIRVGSLVDGILDKFDIERRHSAQRIVGGIFKGRIKNLDPGLKAAFVDIGMPKNAFLHYWDIQPQEADSSIEVVRVNSSKKKKKQAKIPLKEIPNHYPIGTEIVIQITKGPIGTKGPRSTTNLSIPGRFIVLVPNSDQCGISRKIEDNKERARLKKIIRDLTIPEGMGIIVRTAGEGKKARYFVRDLHILLQTWEKIQKKMDSARAPACLYKEPDLAERTVRDFLTEDIDRVLIDNAEDHERISETVAQISKRSTSKIQLYQDSIPIFERYNIEKQIEQTFQRQVPLPSGGAIVIEETEALIAIDVNTGSHKNKGNENDTIFQVNCEAAEEVARQIRLRNIGGLIIIDFIDMKQRRHRNAILSRMRDAMSHDKAKTHILPISPLGIMQMTRQRMQESVSSGLYTDCPYCRGKGIVKSGTTVSVELQRKLSGIIRRARNRTPDLEKPIKLRILVNPSIIDRLREEDADLLISLEKDYNAQLTFRADPNFHVENYRVIDVETGAAYG
ncbi:Rne/Rng family ribonuclease [Pelagicoccus sp. NFK12]|uniref:Rne/Rng family ribonuclease n=1 Tax=Pelagicoccus enzymogenes TaxID=2773457 RepID=A0A927FA36_9BACT|nr:Rne/Rng family ribonuclease [Pelagicoccus enzymogenes]MBD5781104.1 Rne/Rng family ribonuclease [Pelagicoccus enzymogenes]MDQ8199810.1 Rne/Rng family ribonuclease [Pelagicoccus enzymogenes]